MLTSDLLAVRLQALQSLQTLADRAQGARSAAVAEGVSIRLVDMLMVPMWFKSEAGLASLQLMLALCKESAGRAAIIAAGAIRALVGILPRFPGERQIWSLRLVSTLASFDAGGLSADRVRMEMVVHGAVPQLVAFLAGGGPPGSIEIAAAALAEIAKNRSAIASLLEMGTVCPLIALLDSDQVSVQEQAAWALSSLACTNESRNAVYDAGALPHVARLASCRNPAVQAPALATIAALAGRDPRGFGSYGSVYTNEADEEVDDIGAMPLDSQIFLDGELIEVLGRCLRSESPAVQEEAARAVMQLCPIERIHESILGSGAVTTLLQLLYDGTRVAQGYAGVALRLLACSEKRLEFIEASIPGPTADPHGNSPDDIRHREILRKLKHYCF